MKKSSSLVGPEISPELSPTSLCFRECQGFVLSSRFDIITWPMLYSIAMGPTIPNSGHYNLRDGVPLLVSIRWFQLLNASPPSRVRRWGHWIVPARLNNTVLAWSTEPESNWRQRAYQARPLPTEVSVQILTSGW